MFLQNVSALLFNMCVYCLERKRPVKLLLNHQEYQRCFHRTKEKLEKTPSERQFDFSEMYIFWKFDTFQQRLNKILEMFSTISTYSALQDSKIEGLETMATRFQVGIFFTSDCCQDISDTEGLSFTDEMLLLIS